MNPLEILSVITSLISVFLVVKNNIWAWPLGIVSNLLYLILFYQTHIWGNLILQIVFIGQSIYCWYNWNKPDDHKISWMNKSDRYKSIAILLVISYVMYFFLSYFNEKSLYLDAFTTTLCISGMFYLSKRKIENWIFWVTADTLFIFLFFINGLYILSASYLVFLGLATSGFLKWKNIKNEQN